MEKEEYYDERARQGATKEERLQSPILPLRHANNWIKACLIQEYTFPSHGAIVLDLCGGKGGDLYKWNMVHAKEVTLVDPSRDSLSEAWKRYTEGKFAYKFIFIEDDASTLTYLQHLQHARFDVISCQFALHYLFTTPEQAIQTFSNVAKFLRPGGYFIGTILSASRVLQLLRGTAEDDSERRETIGNSLYTLHMSKEEALKEHPTCQFWLKDAIGTPLPETLIRLTTLVGIAGSAGFEPIRVGTSFTEYGIEKQKKYTLQHLQPRQALSSDMMEVFSLYEVFVFMKKYT